MNHRVLWCIRLVAAVIPVFAGLDSAHELRAQSEDISPDNQWNSIFNNPSGWVGGDGAGSIDLGDGRTLWMFGDSLVGEIQNGKYKPGTEMVNNALGVSRLGDDGLATIQFIWGPVGPDKKSTAWLVPDTSHVKPSDASMHPEYPDGWFWPAGGGCVFETEQGRKLAIFLFHVGRTQEDRGVWSFKNVGGAVAIVDNPGTGVEDWSVRQLDLPFTVDQDQIQADPSKRETTWGLSCLTRTEELNGKSVERIYIYGARLDSKTNRRQIVLARVVAAEFADFDQWQFLSKVEPQPIWNSSSDQLATVADFGVPEFSVESFETESGRKLLMVQSDPTLGPKIYVRKTLDPWGPWSRPKRVYQIPELAYSKNYFAYAAKGHQSVSRPGKVMITYVVNSTDFWEMLGDPRIYRPRCLSFDVNSYLEDRSK